jgi:hypothetical protein
MCEITSSVDVSMPASLRLQRRSTWEYSSASLSDADVSLLADLRARERSNKQPLPYSLGVCVAVGSAGCAATAACVMTAVAAATAAATAAAGAHDCL